MSVNGITSSSCTNMINQYGNMTQRGGTNRQASVDGNRPVERHSGGGLIDAIMESLSQAGVGQTSSTDNSGSSTSSDTSGTAQNAVQAFGNFMQNLMGALHAQSASGEQPPNDIGGVERHGHSGGPQKMESNLESLITQISSSDSSTSISGTTSASDSSSTSRSDLEQSFSTLVSALSGSSNSTSLESFLETLASKLQSNGPSGNVINTQA